MSKKPQIRTEKTFDELKKEFGDRFYEYDVSIGDENRRQRVLDNSALSLSDDRLFKYIDDPTLKDLGNNLYRRDLYSQPDYDEGGQLRHAGGDVIGSNFFIGNQKLDKNTALNLIRSGISVPFDAITSTGLGSNDNFRHSFNLAHVRSPAYAAMVEQFDSNYGTKGARQIAHAFADRAGISRQEIDKVAGEAFADSLQNGKYSIYNQDSMTSVGNKALDYIQSKTGQAIPSEARSTLTAYTGQLKGLTDIPHPKSSGFFKQTASDFTGGLLDLGGALLKPIGLEKYAAPIIGAGITAASGGTLGTVGAAIAGGAFAGGANQIAAGDFSGGLKGAALGGAAGGIGGLASTVNPVTSLGAQGNLIANQTIQGGLGGAAGGLLTGENPIKSGLLGAGLAGATTALSAGIQSGANAVKNAVAPNRGDISTGLSPADSFGAGAARQPGINMDRFNPSTGLATDGLSVGAGGVGLRTPSLPVGGGIGISVPIRNPQGQIVGFQTAKDFIKPNFTNAIGDPSSIYNSPELLGRDVVSADGVRKFGAPNAPVTSELSDRAAQRLIGGLLGGGAIAAGAGLLGNRGGSGGQMPQQAARPLDQFSINPQVNQYQGDFNTFGERGSQGFRFYNAPVTGLLG